jgi:PIN domain nuclease of toxin-antitoxin system
VIDYIVDAHALIWYLEGNPKLGKAAREILDDPNSVLLLPSIALAEACWAARKGRTTLSDWQMVVEAVKADSRVAVVELDFDTVELAMTLPPSLEMHDAQVVATALMRQRAGRSVKLLSVDEAITLSGLVPTLW